MRREVYLNNQRIKLDPASILGAGGEAEVFDLSGVVTSSVPLALKVWMPPDHPAFAGSDPDSERNRQAAAERIREYGLKLREFPKGLPQSVVAPRDLATDGHTSVLGYSMEHVRGAEPLRMLGQRSYRLQKGIEAPEVIRVFQSLHQAVRGVHDAKTVIGDFNYLNVLVRGAEPFLIDSDSFQFGRWLSRTFTTRFVDPMICDKSGRVPIQAKPHSPLTDWYAYALMLFECLMFVGPYGGVYRPRKKASLIPEDARPLKRISVFHPEVIYPQKAQPLSWLPKPAAEFFGKLLEDDWRGEFPPHLLEVLLAHAEGRVSEPEVFSPQAGTLEVMSGQARVIKRFNAPGYVEHAALQDGVLRVVYHEGGVLKREDGEHVLATPRDPGFRIRVSGRKTLIGKAGILAILEPGESPAREALDSYQGRYPVFDANARHYYWVASGILYRDDEAGPKALGTVLKNQTLFWVGSHFGVGFYRTGAALTAFVFDAERPGINDSISLPLGRGEIVEANCVFSSNRAWLFMTLRRGADMVNRCVVIRPDGTISGVLEAPEGSDGWLGSIHGKCAATVSGIGGGAVHRLYSVSDEGLVGIDDLGTVGTPPSETVHFPNTKRLVLHDVPLLANGAASILQVDSRAVWELKF